MAITLTRFADTVGSYNVYDAYVASYYAGDQNVRLETLLEIMKEHMASFLDQPTAFHFGEWKAGKNDSKNLVANHTITLEYLANEGLAERLVAKLNKLDWSYYMFDSFDHVGHSTVTVVVPLATSVDFGQYTRLASILAYQLDEYSAADGFVAHTHLIHFDRRTEIVVRKATLLDPVPYIRKTKNDYQGIRALKYEKRRPHNAHKVHLEEPTWTQDDSGLFAFPETPAQRILREAGLPLQ